MKRALAMLIMLGLAASTMLVSRDAHAIWLYKYVHPARDCHLQCQSDTDSVFRFYDDQLQITENMGYCGSNRLICTIDIPNGKDVKKVVPYGDFGYGAGGGSVAIVQDGDTLDYFNFTGDLTGSSYLQPGSGETWEQRDSEPLMLEFEWDSSTYSYYRFDYFIVYYE